MPGLFEQKLDASELIFFQRELESVKKKAYDKKYPQLKARSLLSPDFTSHPGSKTITYTSFSNFGIAKFIANYAKDLPRAGIKGQEFTSNVREIGVSYGWTWKDVKSAAKVGLNLVDREAMAAKRAFLQLENTTAWSGNAENNILGFFSNANLPTAAATADGSGSSPLWINKTPDQIIRDVGACIMAVGQNTNGVEDPNTFLFPHNRLPSLTARIPDTSMTVLEFLKKTYPQITVWDYLVELNTAGTGATAMMVAYNRDPEYLTLEIPQDFLQLPVQEEGLEYKVPCVGSSGGVIMYYPLAANSTYGI